jgi:hypothetical protein
MTTLLKEGLLRLEECRAALPDAWMAHRDGVPKELIESISVTIDKLRKEVDRLEAGNAPFTATELLLLAFARGEVADKVDWDDLGAAVEAAKREMPGRYEELCKLAGADDDEEGEDDEKIDLPSTLTLGVIGATEDEETLFWSNVDGWGGLGTATQFSLDELRGHLPFWSEENPAWIKPLAWIVDPSLAELDQAFNVSPEAVRGVVIHGVRRVGQGEAMTWRIDADPEAFGVFVTMPISQDLQPAGYFGRYEKALEHAQAIAEESYRSLDDQTNPATRW